MSLTCLGLSLSWFNNSSSTSFVLDLFIEIRSPRDHRFGFGLFGLVILVVVVVVVIR